MCLCPSAISLPSILLYGYRMQLFRNLLCITECLDVLITSLDQASLERYHIPALFFLAVTIVTPNPVPLQNAWMFWLPPLTRPHWSDTTFRLCFSWLRPCCTGYVPMRYINLTYELGRSSYWRCAFNLLVIIHALKLTNLSFWQSGIEF